MTDPTEQDELESGLTSGFWKRFTSHAEREWGASGLTYQEAIKRAVQGPVGSEAEAVQRLKVVAAQQAAIQCLLQWPRERVAHLQTVKARAGAEASPSRRGPGL